MKDTIIYFSSFVKERKCRPAFALLLLVLLALVACRGEGNARTVVVTEVAQINGEEVIVTRVVRQTVVAPVTVTPDPNRGAPVVLDLSYPNAATVFDPQRAVSDIDMTMVENLFVGLTRYNHATNTVEPMLATNWEVSQDGRTWTFYLRDDVFWIRPAMQQQALPLAERRPEAIRPVTAGDVVTAVQRLCGEVQSPDVFIFFIISGCEAVYTNLNPTEGDLAAIGVRALNDTTLEISLTKPASYFETMTSMGLLRPVPGDIIAEAEEEGLTWSTLQNVVTSGPFTIGQGTVSETRMVLERNPFYPIEVPGNVDLINIWWLSGDNAFEMWNDKDVDIIPLPPGRQTEVQNNLSLRTRMHLVTRQRVFYLAYNFNSGAFSEPTVRRAFGAAIDREALVEDVYQDRALPMRHFTPPGVAGAPPIDLVGSGYNVDLARIEMANSPFRDCRFMPEIRYMVGGTDQDLFLAETIRRMWMRTLSCQEDQIVIEQVQFGTLLANTLPDAGERRPDIWNLGWASYFPDAHNWLSDVLHCRDSENRQNRPCSEVDDLIRQASTTRNHDQRWDLYRQAERLFFGEGGLEPITPLVVQGEFYLVHPWVTYTPANFGGEQFYTYQLDASTKELERQQ